MESNTVWYVAISDGYWGCGHTAEEAKKEMFKAGATRIQSRIVKKLPKGAMDPWVDDFGRICWDWEDGKPRPGRCGIVERKGL